MNLAEWFDSTKPLVNQLPIHFDSGAHLDEFNGECSRCKAGVVSGNLRGTITHHAGFVEIDAFAYCPACNLLTPYRYDVWDDLSIVGRSPSDNKAIKRWTHNDPPANYPDTREEREMDWGKDWEY